MQAFELIPSGYGTPPRIGLPEVSLLLSAAAGPETVIAFTPRENEVMRRVANGRLGKEIADELGISCSAVRKHLRNIFRKLQVSNRTEAAMKWMLVKSEV